MSVEKATGEFETARRVVLTMNKQDGAKAATSFTLSVDGQDSLVPVSQFAAEACGSVAYSAETAGGLHLTVIDHSARLCDDARPHRWEAEIRKETFAGLSEMVAGGNPESVMSIQAKGIRRDGVTPDVLPTMVAETICHGQAKPDATVHVNVLWSEMNGLHAVVAQDTLAGRRTLGAVGVIKRADGTSVVYEGTEFKLTLHIESLLPTRTFPAELAATVGGVELAEPMTCALVR